MPENKPQHTAYEYAILSRLAYGKEEDIDKEYWKIMQDKGWQKVDTIDISKSWDTRAVIFYNKNSQEQVIAFKGTDTESRWNLMLDVGIAHKKQPPINDYKNQVKLSIEKFLNPYKAVFLELEKKSSSGLIPTLPPLYNLIKKNFESKVKQVQQLNIVFTGHSLGGLMAELATCIWGNENFFQDIQPYLNNKLDIVVNAVVFDPPGIDCFLNPQEKSFGKNRLFTYVSAPNAVNQAHHHLNEVREFKVSCADNNSLKRLYGFTKASPALTLSLMVGTSFLFLKNWSQIESLLSNKYILPNLVTKALMGTANLSILFLIGALPLIKHEIDWLLHQHSILNIIKALEGEKKLVKDDSNCLPAERWPSLPDLNTFWSSPLSGRLTSIAPIISETIRTRFSFPDFDSEEYNCRHLIKGPKPL